MNYNGDNQKINFTFTHIYHIIVVTELPWVAGDASVLLRIIAPSDCGF